MSMWLTPADGEGPASPDLTPLRQDRLAMAGGVAVVALGLSLLFWQARFRLEEAKVAAGVLRLLHLRPADTMGTNVVFPLHDRWVGYSLTVACTAALLVVPFFLIAGLLVFSGRVDRRRAAVALAVATVLIFAINQLRLLVIAGSMVLWGFRIGYERSHILLGTVLSTFGVIIGVIVFIWMLIDTSEHRDRSRRGSAHG